MKFPFISNTSLAKAIGILFVLLLVYIAVIETIKIVEPKGTTKQEMKELQSKLDQINEEIKTTLKLAEEHQKREDSLRLVVVALKRKNTSINKKYEAIINSIDTFSAPEIIGFFSNR